MRQKTELLLSEPHEINLCVVGCYVADTLWSEHTLHETPIC